MMSLVIFSHQPQYVESGCRFLCPHNLHFAIFFTSTGPLFSGGPGSTYGAGLAKNKTIK
jgi:hypothetical protein